MDDITDYNSVVQTLEDIEQGDQEIRTAVINTKEALASQISMEEYNYEEACEEIGFAEGIRRVEPAQFGTVQKQVAVAPRIGVSKETFDAAKEIKQIVGSAGREFEGIVGREAGKVSKEKLILPTLSLQDQIHDLEGISEGLDNSAFNQEQLGVIGLEIDGLSEKIKYEKVMTGDEFQKSLMELRNKLLTEDRKKFGNN